MINKKGIKIIALGIISGIVLSFNLCTAYAWGPSEHKALADLYGSFGSTTEEEAFKAGCVYPDNAAAFSGAKGQYHGGLWTDWTSGVQSNYMNCYIYLTKTANALGNGTTYSVSSSAAPELVAMNGKFTLSKIGGVAWAAPYNTDNKLKRAFVFGMAMHTATDAFAHSAWCPDIYGKWNRIIHVTGASADDIYYIQERYTAAEQVAIKILKRYFAGTDGTTFDFGINKSYFSNGTFYLGNFSAYANESGSSYYNNTLYKANYDAADLWSNVSSSSINFEGHTILKP